MTTIYESAEKYLDAPEGMRNEVEMSYTATSLFLQEIVKNKNNNKFGQLSQSIGYNLVREIGRVSILDVCCGLGNFANYLSLVYTQLDVTGIDLNEKFLGYAQNKFPSWRFLKEDARNFNLDTEFDFVLASSAYHHIEDEHKIQFLKNIKNHLSSTGKVIVCENFIPNYLNNDSRLKAIHQYYQELKDYYSSGNSSPEAFLAIEEVYQLELSGKEEHKVDFKRFQNHILQSGLEIEVDKIIWQPLLFRKSNAGSHVLLLNAK